MKKTFYEILDVPPDASDAQIAFAYRRALDRVMRDGQAEPRAEEEVRSAYRTLSDASLRETYNINQRRAIERYLNGPDDATGGWLSTLWVRVALGVIALLIGLVWWKSRRSDTPVAPPVHLAATAVVEAESTGSEPSSGSPRLRVAAGGPPRSAEEVFATVSGSVAKVIVNNGFGEPVSSGSGVVIGPGSVVTNCHVTRAGPQISVKFGPDTFPANVAVADEEFDLCRLDVAGLQAPAVPIGTVKSVRVGQKVFAIGSPYGLENTLSEGLVSALRDVPGGTVIQTSAPISPGSSGGGLFDASGRLVGIITFQHRFGQNLNFAIPVDWINDMQTRGPGAGLGAMTSQPASP